jgi:short-subunit dehydrogenase
MVEVNCVALTALCAEYVPQMVERGRGAVLNVGSTASFQPLPGSATYAATKAFVLSFSEATHAELRPEGVSVTALCPGPVRTAFGQIAGAGTAEERLPGPFWLEADAVARQAIEGMERGKRVVVPGIFNRAGAIGGQHAPRSVLLPVIGRAARRVF